MSLPSITKLLTLSILHEIGNKMKFYLRKKTLTPVHSHIHQRLFFINQKSHQSQAWSFHLDIGHITIRIP